MGWFSDNDDDKSSASLSSTKSVSDDDDIDPLDAYMTGIGDKVASEAAELSSGAKKRAKIERLDVEGEEEATAHWMNKADKIEIDDKASKSGSILSHGLASTFTSSSSTSSQSVSMRGKNDSLNDEDYLKKQRDAEIEPLPTVVHASIPYSPFNRLFLKVSDTPSYKSWRDSHKISIGPDSFDPILSFSCLSISKVSSHDDHIFPESLLKAIRSSGIEKPTPVQAQTLPVALAGRDAMVTANTGSGKTLAFVWPLVVHCCDQSHIQPGVDGPIGLVLTPTRELATQIYNEAKKMFKPLQGTVVCCVGGMGKWEMTKELKKGCELIVSTPGRLIDMVKSKATNLRRVTMVILDEADRMLEMGFETQVRSILRNIRPDRQTLLFSATFKTRIAKAAQAWLNDPIRISVGKAGTSSEHVEQHVFNVGREPNKITWLVSILPTLIQQGKVIVFVASRASCEDVAKKLINSGVPVESIHGEKRQHDRTLALSALKKGKIKALVATDVAARGLDIKDVQIVINYDPAKNLDMHVHRVGRAGRMSSSEGEYGKGAAYTVLTEKDSDFASSLVEAFQREGRVVEDDLIALARKSRHFGRGGQQKRSYYGIGYHQS